MRQPPRSLALIGFMGAGKSAVGRAVAVALGLPFIDTDERIAAQHGDIAEIFAVRGEDAFRRIERAEVVAAVATALVERCVLSVGGGAVLSGDVREALGDLTCVVWLTAPADTLWARVVAGEDVERPLATDEFRFRRLLEERSALYESVATDVLVNDGSKSPAQVASVVARLVLDSAQAEAAP